MSAYWFPAYGHPDGPSAEPWFRVEDGWGYRAAGHPEGASSQPCLKIGDGCAYPTFSLPREATASFEIIGSFVYPAGTTGPPWFCIASNAHPATRTWFIRGRANES